MHLEWTDYRREDGPMVDNWLDGLTGETTEKFCAVVFSNNLPSQRAFEKAGFVFDYVQEGSWNYIYKM